MRIFYVKCDADSSFQDRCYILHCLGGALGRIVRIKLERRLGDAWRRLRDRRHKVAHRNVRNTHALLHRDERGAPAHGGDLGACSGEMAANAKCKQSGEKQSGG
jgi:hypothetical protein